MAIRYRNSKLKFALLLLFVTLIGVCFQNCSSGFGAMKMSLDQSSSAFVNQPWQVSTQRFDTQGNFYFSELGTNTIRRINSRDGTLQTVAGLVGSAFQTNFSNPWGTAYDKNGNLFLADNGLSVVYKIEKSTNKLTLVAGQTNKIGYSGDGGPATLSLLSAPTCLAVDQQDNVFICDSKNLVIRRVDGKTGVITTFAGGNSAALAQVQDGMSATATGFTNEFAAIAVDTLGNLFIADGITARVLKVTPIGILSVYAGTGKEFDGNNDGVLATQSSISIPHGLSFDPGGNLLIADYQIRRVDSVTGIMTTYAGSASSDGINEDGHPANKTILGEIASLAVDRAGNIYFSALGQYSIRKIDVNSNLVHTISGVFPFVALNMLMFGSPKNLNVGYSNPVVIDADDNLVFIVNPDRVLVRINAQTGLISPVAGIFHGVFPKATQATESVINGPGPVVVSPLGELYFSDVGNRRILKVNKAGMISTVVGNGTDGYSGDGGLGTQAQIGSVWDLSFDLSGDLYFVDSDYSVIRKLNLSNNVVTTIAGDGTFGYSGDGGLAINARLNSPTGLAFDSANNLWIADSSNNVVRRILSSTGKIETIAGTSEAGYSGDGGASALAQMNSPTYLAINSKGDIFIFDAINAVIRKLSTVDSKAYQISTVVGTGVKGTSGDNDFANKATIQSSNIKLNSAGDLILIDYTSGRIRQVSAKTGIISTIAGGSSQNFTDDNSSAIGSALIVPN